MKIKNLILLFVFISLAVFAQEKKTIVHPEWSKNAVIYEVNTRQFTPEGTFKAFEKHLPAVKSSWSGYTMAHACKSDRQAEPQRIAWELLFGE